jgi:hypothetical protein
MGATLLKPRTRRILASTLLVAFASRAFIPPGFMPAADRPFSIEICPEGFPAEMLARSEPAHEDSVAPGSMPGMSGDSTAAHSMPGMASESVPKDSDPAGAVPGHGKHHHPGSPSSSEHCVFGTACSAGPIPHLPLLSGIFSAREPRAVAASPERTVRLVHLPQARAPPRIT